jgi:hypothetical protein
MEKAQRILSAVVYICVATNARHRKEVYLRACNRKCDGKRVIKAGIAIHDNG